MSVKNYGLFLGNLNHSGRIGKIIKTMPDFEVGTDPEIIKMNLVIRNAKNNGDFIISRANKSQNYVSGIMNSTLISTILNNEYFGIISSNVIHEFKYLGSRPYDKIKDIEVLSPFIDNIDIEKYSEIKKNFNDVIKLASSFQVIIREDGKFKSISKGMDNTLVDNLVISDYLCVFTKGSNITEFQKIGSRKITDITPPPSLYSGINDELTSHTVIPQPPPIPIIPKESEKKTKNVTLEKFNDCVRRANDFSFVKYKNCEFNDEYGYIYGSDTIGRLIDLNYCAFRKKNTDILLEFYSLGTRDLSDNMVEEMRICDFGFSSDRESYIDSIKIAINTNNFIYRTKDGKYSHNYFNVKDNFYNTKMNAILSGDIDYFGIIYNAKIIEFVKIGSREIINDRISLPVLPAKKSIRSIEFENNFRDIVLEKDFRIISLKNGMLSSEKEMLWQYKIKGSSNFAVAISFGNAPKKLHQFKLIAVSDFNDYKPSTEIFNVYGFKNNFEVSFSIEKKFDRNVFLLRKKCEPYEGVSYLSLMNVESNDYIAFLDRSNNKVYEYVKTKTCELNENIEIPKWI
jgi:hypothetical protein